MHDFLPNTKPLSAAELDHRLEKAVQDHERAEKEYGQALACAEEVGNELRRLEVLTSIGRLHLRRTNSAQAEACFREVRKLAVAQSDRRHAGLASLGLAELAFGRGDASETLSRANEALADLEAISAAARRVVSPGEPRPRR